MIDENDWPRLARYFAGECSREEAAKMRAWIEADIERSEAAAALRETWDRVGHRVKEADGLDTLDLRAAWNTVVDKKEGRVPVMTPRFAKPTTRPTWWQPLWRIAAAVVLLSGGIVAWQSVRLGYWNVAAPLTTREIVTPRGQRMEVRLSDGTRVVLAAESRLRFASRFSDRREVHLEGEGYFEVVHDERRPFLIHTAGAVIEDLGTAFAVQSYPEDPQVQVMVTEGKVELRGREALAHSATTLVPGQLGRLRLTDGHLEVHTVDPAPHIAWLEGKLVFDNTPLSQVIRQLSRWYDIDIHLDDPSVGARPLSASFQHESIAEVLEVIGPSLDLRVRRDGPTVILTPRS